MYGEIKKTIDVKSENSVFLGLVRKNDNIKLSLKLTNIDILNGEGVVEPNNLNFKIYGVKHDGTPEEELYNIEFLDGVLVAKLKNNFTNIVGDAYIELTIYKQDVQMTTCKMNYRVTDTLEGEILDQRTIKVDLTNVKNNDVLVYNEVEDVFKTANISELIKNSNIE